MTGINPAIFQDLQVRVDEDTRSPSLSLSHMHDATVALPAELNPTKTRMDVALSKSSDIPYTTRWYRANGRPSKEDQAKSQLYLTPSEEETLVKCLVQMSHNGFSIPKKYLRPLAYSIARRRSSKVRTSASNDTIRPPSKNWPQAFFKRHPGLEASMARRRDWNRHDKNMHSNIQHCFEGIKVYLDEEDVLPENLYNMDEIGANHIDTPKSNHVLALPLPLRDQQKNTKAEPARQQEKVIGANEKDTLASKELFQKVILAKASSAPTNVVAETVFSRSSNAFANGKNNQTTHTNSEIQQVVLEAPTPTITITETVSRLLSDFFANGNQRQLAYTDSEIRQVSLLLVQVNPQWSKVPRIYIVLRTIDCLDLLDTFIDIGVSDHWFPFTERSLPPCLWPGRRSQFMVAQNLVMTKSMDLEKGEMGQHCYFKAHEPLPFEMKGILGSGGYGQVDKVLSRISFRVYALKRVSRSLVFSGPVGKAERRRDCVKQLIAEIGILKRLKHQHVVEFVGSYTDPKHIGLIMSPVADMDLSAYLACADTARYKELRTFFGCLARALEFLHEQSIRHKDIKPSNILVHGGNVLFTDFGLSFDFTDEEGSTTVSVVNGLTRKYCAPEVADEGPRNTSSDIWSLGVVFLEMIAVLKGRTVEYVYDFLREHGSQQAFVRTNPTGTLSLITELKETGSSTSNVALGWVQDMTMLQRQLRPTAASLIAAITSAGQMGDDVFYGICCALPDDVLSDLDGLEVVDDE
jgi:serine/threonine protein kinase